MQCATIKNLLPNTKIKLKDDHLCQIVSIFYNHPRLLEENGWDSLKVGSETILIDKDTLYITQEKEIELIWDKERITHIKLKSNLTGEKLKQHWDKMLKHGNMVRKAMQLHFDTKKVDDLCGKFDEVSVSSD